MGKTYRHNRKEETENFNGFMNEYKTRRESRKHPFEDDDPIFVVGEDDARAFVVVHNGWSVTIYNGLARLNPPNDMDYSEAGEYLRGWF